jgi:hypothetical protein
MGKTDPVNQREYAELLLAPFSAHHGHEALQTV